MLPIRLIAATDGAWDDVLSRTDHDLYHTSRYHRMWEHAGEPYLAVCGDEDRFLAWPFLLSPIDAGQRRNGTEWLDVTAVYGYGGPVARNCEPGDEFTVRAFEAIAREWRSLGVVSAFTRFNPLLENHRWVAPASGFPGLWPIGDTVSLDLRLSNEEVQSGYRRTVRQQVRHARANGLVSFTDENWNHLDGFVRLLHQTMDRNRAAAEFYLPAEFFRQLRGFFPRGLFLRVVSCGPYPESAGVFLEYRGIMHTLYIGNSSEAACCHATKLLIDDAQQWARERGARVLHLGGGRGARNDDSLFYFKSGFSHRRHPFYVGGWVLDPARYNYLAEARMECALRAGSTLDPDFFPAYRSPFVTSQECGRPNAAVSSAAACTN